MYGTPCTAGREEGRKRTAANVFDLRLHEIGIRNCWDEESAREEAFCLCFLLFAFCCWDVESAPEETRNGIQGATLGGSVTTLPP